MAPHSVLAYRAECVPDVKTVVLSSVQPIRVSTICDTDVQSTNIFDTFPTLIDTECEIKEHINGTEKTILPQMQSDFYQNQMAGKIIRPKIITKNSTETTTFNLTPIHLITISTLGAVFASLSVFVTILAIFDPQKCANITRTLCCCCFRLFFSCKHCCKHCKYYPPSDTENNFQQHEMKTKTRKGYHQSQTSIPSAPALDPEEVSRFLPAKSPALSQKSSIYAIRRADSVATVENERYQYPQNPSTSKIYR